MVLIPNAGDFTYRKSLALGLRHNGSTPIVIVMKINTLSQLAIAIAASISLLSNPASANPGKSKGNSGAAHNDKGKGKSKDKDKDKGNDKDKGKDHDKDKPDHRKGSDDRDNVRFDKNDHDLIRSLFGTEGNRTNLPPGLAKNLKRGKPLPPGWQKKLVPGYRIEDSWMESFTPVSYDDLPRVRRVPNTQLYYHENKVVRVANATREILDVIDL